MQNFFELYYAKDIKGVVGYLETIDTPEKLIEIILSHRAFTVLELAAEHRRIDILELFFAKIVALKLTAEQVYGILKSGLSYSLSNFLINTISPSVLEEFIPEKITPERWQAPVDICGLLADLLRKVAMSESNVESLLNEPGFHRETAVTTAIKSEWDNDEAFAALLNLLPVERQKKYLLSIRAPQLASKHYNYKVWAKICGILGEPVPFSMKMSGKAMIGLAEKAARGEPLTLTVSDCNQQFPVFMKRVSMEGRLIDIELPTPELVCSHDPQLPILWAIQKLKFPLVRALAELGANLTVRFNDITPLLAAINTGDVEMLRLVIDLGAAPLTYVTALATRDALCVASAQHNLEMCELLIAAGFKVNTPDGYGRTPLFHANSIVARYLLSIDGVSIDQADAKGITPLMQAAIDGDEAKVSVLLEAAADFRLVDCHNGYTALDYARLYRHVECKNLLKAKAAAVTERVSSSFWDTRGGDKAVGSCNASRAAQCVHVAEP